MYFKMCQGQTRAFFLVSLFGKTGTHILFSCDEEDPCLTKREVHFPYIGLSEYPQKLSVCGEYSNISKSLKNYQLVSY